jgi:hypothetical protein
MLFVTERKCKLKVDKAMLTYLHTNCLSRLTFSNENMHVGVNIFPLSTLIFSTLVPHTIELGSI